MFCCFVFWPTKHFACKTGALPSSFHWQHLAWPPNCGFSFSQSPPLPGGRHFTPSLTLPVPCLLDTEQRVSESPCGSSRRSYNLADFVIWGFLSLFCKLPQKECPLKRGSVLISLHNMGQANSSHDLPSMLNCCSKRNASCFGSVFWHGV